MAAANMTHERALEVADEAKVLADQTGALLAKIERFLAFNSHQAINWGAGEEFLNEVPAEEPGEGNLVGRRFTRQQVSNAIFSLDQIQRLLDNQTVTQGDHLGNLNQLAQVMPIR